MKSVLPERNVLHPHDIEERELPRTHGNAIRELAQEICITLDARSGGQRHAARTLTDPALIEQIDARVYELPAKVWQAMRPPTTTAGATIVRNLPFTDDELGPTPPSWHEAADWSGDLTRPTGSFQLDVAMLLLARCAGKPFGWGGQQNGRLVNNILPSVGHENEQSGASSKTLLSPHSEDAFHPGRANLLMLCCLRNPDLVGTTVSSVRHVDLTARHRALLSTPTLPILPDVSYGSGHQQYATTTLPTLWTAPKAPELADDTSSLTLRYDPAYTPLDDGTPEFRSAYSRLTAELERVCVTVTLAPGDLLLMDNDVAVHGRVPFTARYDGTDRWLKRVNIHLPERPRRPAEAKENGYGQQTIAPFHPVSSARRDTTPHDRGTVE